MHVGEFQWGMRKLDPKRERNLLLSKKEILWLLSKVKTLSVSLIPLELYTKGNLIKVSVAIAHGRKRWEKKQVLKERDLDREIHKIYR
jgi:SsrA-binding protein